MKLLFTYAIFSTLMSWFGVEPTTQPTTTNPVISTPGTGLPIYLLPESDLAYMLGAPWPSKDLLPANSGLSSFKPLVLAANVTATKTATLSNDLNNNGAYDPGDEILYTITITNSGNMDATGMTFDDTPDANTTLVAGSQKSTPILFPDTYSCIGNVGINVNVAASGVLGNDFDLNGLTLQATAINTAGTQGVVVMNPDGTFTFKPNQGFSGATTFTYTVSNGFFASTTTVTINVTTPVWFIDNNAGVNGDGRLGTPFISIANFVTAAADHVNEVIFLYRNTATNYTGPLTLKNGQILIGAGASSSIPTISGITVPPFSNTLPSTGGTKPVIGTNGLTVGSGNKVWGLDINSTATTGFSGTGVGNLQVRDCSVTSTNQTAVTITGGGTLDVVFKSVSSSGASTGINVSNTSGAFGVFGSGTAASGGTISNITNRGAQFTNASNVQLKYINFSNANMADAGGCTSGDNSPCNGAVYLNNVTNAVLEGDSIHITAQEGINARAVNGMKIRNCTIFKAGSGLQTEECGIYAQNMTGSDSITGCLISSPADRGIIFYNSASTLNLTLKNTTIRDNQGLPVGADLFEFDNLAGGTLTLRIHNCNFINPKTNGVQVITDGSGSVSNVDITNSTFDPTTGLGAAIDLDPNNSGVMKFNIIGNTVYSRGINAINVFGQGLPAGCSFEGRINNNIVKVLGNTSGAGIRVFAQESCNGKVLIDNNTVGDMANPINETGIQTVSRLGTGRLDATVTNNTVYNTAGSFFNIEVTAGNSTPGSTNKTCGNVVNNVIPVGGAGPFVFRGRAAAAGYELLLQGPGPDVATNWTSNGNTPGTTSQPASGGTYTFGATCLTVSNALPNFTSDPVDALAANPTTTTNTQAVDTTAAPAPATGNKKHGYSKPDGLLSTIAYGPFNLPANSNVKIFFKVTINNPFPAGVCTVSNQATISGSNFATVLTDDPGVGGSADPTVVTLTKIPPTIATCPSDVTVTPNNPDCTSMQSYPITATGCPPPTITYKIGATTITYPYNFPPGISTVVSTAANGNLPNATCTHTVTVNVVVTYFNVTGGGNYCTGSTAPSVGLDGSQVGFSYQLKLNNVNIGASVPGTGMALDFGPQSGSGTYTVEATGSGCTIQMTGSAVVAQNSVTASTIAGNQTICEGGNPAAFTVSTPATGTGVLTYQWQSGTGGCGGSFTNIAGATSATYDAPSGLNQSTYYRVVVTSTLNGFSCSATSNCITVLVNIVSGGTYTGDQSICPGGNPVAFTVVVNGSSSLTGYVSRLWQKSTVGCGGPFTNLFGDTLATYDPPPLAVTTYYRVQVFSTFNGVTCPVAYSNCLTVNANGIPPTISCPPNATVNVNNASCSSTQTYAASQTGGCPAATFTYSIGGNPITFPYNFPIGTTTVDVVGSNGNAPNASCSFTVTVNPPTTVFNVTGGGTFCAGTTAPSVGLSGSLVGVNYQLLLNNGAVGAPVPGTGSALDFGPQGTTGTYTVTGTIVASGCVANMNGSVGVTQNTVNAGAITNITLVVCSGGDPAAFSVAPSTGTGVLTYQWQSSTTGCNGTFTNIPGATSAAFDPPSGLVTTTSYQLVVTTTVNGLGCSTTSNCHTITVNDVTSGAIGSDQTICSGAATALTSQTAATGTGSVSYQWQSNTTGCNGVYANIGGATSSTLNIPSGVVTQTTYYRRVATSTVSGVGCSASSNCITVTVNTVTPGTIGSDQTVCSGGDPALLSASVNATASGVLTYQWQSNTTGCNGAYANIPGATSASYDPPAGLTQTTYYQRVATSTLNNVVCSANSNCVTVFVNNVTASVVGSDQNITPGGDPAAFTVLTAAGGTGVLSYQWQSGTNGCNGAFANIGGATSATYDPPNGLNATTNYRVIVTSTLNGVACTATSNCITVSINSVTPSVVAADQSICQGGDPAAFTVVTPAVGTGALTYQWQSNTSGCGSPFVDIPGATSPTYDVPAGLNQTTYYHVVVTSTIPGNSVSGASNCLKVTVKPTPDVNAIQTQVLCINTPSNPINFTGAVPGTTFSWTNSTPSIGLGASGTGDIPVFTPSNKGVGIITVTPTANGCPGNPIIFLIIVL